MMPASCPSSRIANVACGFHASDPTVMHKTVRLAKRHDVKVGAHPSLPDLQGFGRREMKMDPKELTDCLIYQVGALKAFLDAEGMTLNHIKPHGALYGMAARSEEIANAICDAAEVFEVPLLGMAGTKHEEVYTKRGFRFMPEFYVDLDYDEDGQVDHHPRARGLGPEARGRAHVARDHARRRSRLWTATTSRCGPTASACIRIRRARWRSPRPCKTRSSALSDLSGDGPRPIAHEEGPDRQSRRDRLPRHPQLPGARA